MIKMLFRPTRLLLNIFMFTFSALFSQQINFSNLEIPQLNKNEYIISHCGFSLCYKEEYEQAKWVAYVLTAKETVSLYKRSNKFYSDPAVKTGSASDHDYKRSGYDRGHLAPAGDMSYSANSMLHSFYYSNISPQEPGFNRGIWKKLEEQLRNWANDYDSIYVVTGPVLSRNLPYIGYKVAVPEYFYKVVLRYTNNNFEGIGFILPNRSSKSSLIPFAVCIDSVESFTNINFFPSLPDNIETTVERYVNTNNWHWNSKNLSISHKISASKLNHSVQCKGTTKKGNRCKNRTKNANGFCHLHQNQAP